LARERILRAIVADIPVFGVSGVDSISSETFGLFRDVTAQNHPGVNFDCPTCPVDN